MKKLKKITIVGVGLIGGSIGLAVKGKRLAREVVGVGHHRSSINRAVRLKTIDRGTLNLKEGVKGSDVVILATPILSIVKLTKRIIPYLKDGCIITDVGSAKLKLTQEIEEVLPKNISFVGGHPMAGSEKRGVGRARRDLFKDSICILTKTKNTSQRSLKVIRALWRSLGAEVITLSPEVHDRVVSEISHLPHMLVFSMLSGVDKRDLRFASSGFYDTTRIASSDAKVWKDIAISNKKEIAKSIFKFKKNLSMLEKAINRRDSAALVRIFKRAKSKREIGNPL